MPPRAGDRETLVVEQPLDAEHGLDVLPPVQPVALGALHRLERGEFCLPIAQDKRFGRGQAADLADPEEAFCRKGRFGLAVTFHQALILFRFWRVSTACMASCMARLFYSL